MKLKGRIWKLGNDINTDDIVPAQFLTTTDASELGRHCLANLPDDFPEGAGDGDIIVAGENFGCGSSREHAPRAIKGRGISLVIAKSFARIFFRNAINIGLPILECKNLPDETAVQDILEVDVDKGIIKNLTGAKTYKTTPFPPFLQQLITAGGLMNYIRRKLCTK